MYEIQLTEQQFNAIAQDNSRSKKMNIKGMLLAIVFASIGLFFYLKHYMTQVTSINYSDLIFFAPFFVFVLLAIVFIISQNKSKKKIDTNDFSCKVYVDTIIEKSMFEVQNKKFIKVKKNSKYLSYTFKKLLGIE